MAIGEWKVKASVDVGSVKTATRKLKDEMKSAGDDIENNIGKRGKTATSGLSKAFGSLKTIIASTFVAVGITKFIKSIASLGSQLEQAKISFETLLGSEEKAVQQLEYIDQLASKTPFNKLNLIKTNQQLLGFGFAGEQSLAIMKVLGDSISAVGRGDEDLKGVALALGQIQAKGKLSTEEVLQMAERGLPIFQILEEQLGLTKEQLGDLGNQGIDSATAVNAIMVGLNEKFAGSMEKQAKTLGGMWSNTIDMGEIALGKMGLAVSDNLKGVLEKINTFLENNMGSIIDFGSDVAKNIIGVATTVADLFITTFEIINDAFGILTGENKKNVQDNFKLFKFLAMAIANGFQTVAILVNTALRTVSGAVKALGTGIGGFLFQSFQVIKIAGKEFANYFIEKINGVIKGVNFFLKLMKKSAIPLIQELSTATEKSALESAEVFKDMGDAFKGEFEKMAEKNQEILGKMVDNVTNYENEIAGVGKTSGNVFDAINGQIDEMKDGLAKGTSGTKDLKDAQAKAGDEAKAQIDSIKDKVKALEKEYSDIEKQIDDNITAQKKYADDSKKYNQEILTDIRETNKALEERKAKLDEEIATLQSDEKNTLAGRYVDIKAEEKQIISDIAEIQKSITKEDDAERKLEYEEQIKKLKEEQTKLIEEQAFIEGKVAKEKLDDAERFAGLNSAEQIIEESAKKQALAQSDFEKEKAVYEQRLKINQAFLQLKSLDEKNLTAFMETEAFNRFTKEEQAMIVKLANERIALTEQKNAIILQQQEIANKSIELSNETTAIMLQNTEELKSEYASLISQIDNAIAKQKQLNALKSGGGTGFASGGFTGAGGTNEVAGVVHKGEWVAPKWMVNELKPLFDNLEQQRGRGFASGGNTSTVNKTQNNTINVAGGMDAKGFLDYAKWKL